MAIDKKKLASVIAAGAGAIALTAEKAEASTIVYSGILNRTIGFDTGDDASHEFNTFVGGPDIFFMTGASQNDGHYSRKMNVLSSNLGGFALTTGLHINLATVSAGAQWTNSMIAGGGTRLLGARQWGSSSSTRLFGMKPLTDMFMLFTFSSNSSTRYGWLELSLTNIAQDSNAGADGPNATVIAYAYDASGATIAAGDTGLSSPTPEPSTLAGGALAALVLGAAGLRRWRRAK
jgi:hypothetical protein